MGRELLQKCLFVAVLSGNLLSTLAASIASEAPKITYSKKLHVKPRENVTLDCGVEGVDLTGVDTFNIMWTKLNSTPHEKNLLISSGTNVVASPNKYSIHHPLDTYQYSLQIANISLEDSATYRCVVDFGEGQTINADVPLVVEVPAHFVDSELTTVTVAEGDAISINCQPHGSPIPKVYWEKIGGQLPQEGGDLFQTNQLDLPMVDRRHGGNYRCLADNGLGEVATSEIIVDVEFAPTAAVSNSEVTASVFDKVELTCFSQGNPIPEIVWLRKNARLVNSANVRISSRYDGEERLVSSALTIDKLQAEDFGEYVCAPVNTQGSSEAKALIHLATPPLITKSAKRQIVYTSHDNHMGRSGVPVALECEAKAHPNANYRWVKDGEPLVWQADPRLSLQEATGTLLIENPVLTDNGVYQCFAYNNLGVAASDFIHLRNSSDINFNMEGHSQTSFEAEIGKPFVLRCPHATGFPKPTLNWAKAYDVADGLKIEFVTSKRTVVDPKGNLWFTRITEQDDTYVNNFTYLCLASTNLHPEDLSLAKSVKLRTTPIETSQPDLTSADVNLEPFLLYSSPDLVTFTSPTENKLWCIFGGDPSPQVTWLRIDGQDIDTSRLSTENEGQTLVFQDTRPSDGGKYQCVANNGIGEQNKMTFTVKAELPPKFTRNMIDQSQVVQEGTTVTFVCGIHSNDAKTYEWYFNTQPLAVATGSRRLLEDNKLIIQSTSLADIGNYGCKASNDFGYGFGQAVLNVIPVESHNRSPSEPINNLRQDVEGLRKEVQDLKSLIEQVVTKSATNEAILSAIRKIEEELNVHETELDSDPTTTFSDKMKPQRKFK